MLWPNPLPLSLRSRIPVYEGDAPDGAVLPYVTVVRDAEQGCTWVTTVTWNESGEAPPPGLGDSDATTWRDGRGLWEDTYKDRYADVVASYIREAQAHAALALLTHELLALDWPLVRGEHETANGEHTWYAVTSEMLPGFFVGEMDHHVGPSHGRVIHELCDLFRRYIAAGQWRELAEVRSGAREPFRYDEAVTEPPAHECDHCETCGDCHGCAPISEPDWVWEDEAAIDAAATTTEPS
jgi:hypothetical protein